MGRRIMIAFDGSRGDNQPYLVMARDLILQSHDLVFYWDLSFDFCNFHPLFALCHVKPELCTPRK